MAPSHEFERILIVKLSAIGDILHTLPAAAAPTATTTAMTMAQIQTASPCFSPLNRAMRPAT